MRRPRNERRGKRGGEIYTRAHHKPVTHDCKTRRYFRYTHHGEHRVGAVGARVDRGLGRGARAHDHDFRHRAAAAAAAGRLEVEPPDRGRQKVAVPSVVNRPMLTSRWLRLRRIPRVTRVTPQTAASGCRLAIPRAPLKQIVDSRVTFRSGRLSRE